jgi:phosphoglycerate kinase
MGVELLLPEDALVGDKFAPDCRVKTVGVQNIPEGWIGMSVGPASTERFTRAVRGAGTVVWNGPLGVFEFPAFAESTRAMARALAESGATTIVGGGDSVSAIENMGFADRITHISTGGGASLDFLAGKELPGISCLLDA